MHLLQKLNPNNDAEEDATDEMETETEADMKQEVLEPFPEAETSLRDEVLSEEEEDEECESSDGENKKVDPKHEPRLQQKQYSDPESNITHNRNASSVSYRLADFHEDKPVISDSFKKSFEERKKHQNQHGLLNGYEECDVEDCYCREAGNEATASTSGEVAFNSEALTPTPTAR